MRLVIVRVDSDGRSSVGSDAPNGEIRLITPGTDALQGRPQRVPAMPAALGAGETVVEQVMLAAAGKFGNFQSSAERVQRLDLPHGGVRWTVARFGPGVNVGLHETATVDFDLVLDGAVDLILDRATVRLCAGDAVIIPWARHGWRTSEEQCTLATLMTDASIHRGD